ncbi:farnesyl pyrophosphate synthase 2-like [Malania oleifera]|uniref:farnesyl pyrophosphate synthase 2-like n=1 Tax=Malania oleifera TaxID=397392 RepID=UPI0025AE7024|nr:farnesyl pyrophosphate synthase 2-like [Malania oleifera]
MSNWSKIQCDYCWNNGIGIRYVVSNEQEEERKKFVMVIFGCAATSHGHDIEWTAIPIAVADCHPQPRPRLTSHHSLAASPSLPLLDLFNEVEFQTTCGQMIDLITTLEGEKDLSKYSLPIHRCIVQYKTAYYSFYLPVACALLMFGENLDDHAEVKNILVEMGIYFQVQDDYLDCFGDPEVIGKIGTNIEDFKCSWLVVKALEHCNEEQKKLLRISKDLFILPPLISLENYGKANQANVAKVKELYKELDIEGAFLEYESSSYKKLTNAIEAQPSKAVQVVLKSFLGKIYKRQK